MNKITATRLRIVWARALTGLLVGLSVACSPVDPMGEAREKQAAGDFAGALEPLRAVLAQDPENFEALYMNGVSLNRTGEAGMAQWSLLRAMESPDWFEKAAFEAATGSHVSRSWNLAVQLMSRVLEADPNNIEALQIRAHSHILARNQYAEALADSERVLELDPENQHILPDRAVALIGLDRFEEAESAIADLAASYRESSPSEDLTARFCVTNAMFSAEAGRVDAAEKLYESCFDEFGDTEVAFNGLLGFYDFQNREDRALEILGEAIREKPSAHRYRLEMVRRLEEAQRLDEAEQLLRDALELPDQQTTAEGFWFELGRHYMARGQYQSAVDAAKQGLDHTSNPTPNLRSYYAEALVLAEHYEEALAVADEMTVPSHQALVRARVAFERRQPKIALENFELSLKTWPENPVTRYYAARSAEQMGDFDRAIEEYRYALRSESSQTDAGFRLARILRAEGNDVGAFGIFAQSTDTSDPNLDPEARLLGVELLGALGRKRALRETLTTIAANQSPQVLARYLSQAASGAARGIRVEEGLRLLTHWIELDFTAIENATALEKRVELEAQSGRPEKALELAQAAANAHPNEAIFREILASAKSRNGASADLVLEDYRKALELDPSRAQSMLALARHDALSGEFTSALTRLDTFLEANSGPPAPEVIRQRAKWLSDAGRGDEVEQLLRDLLFEDPTDAPAALALAHWHWESGRNREAARRYALQAQRFGGGDAAQKLLEELSREPAPG